MLDQNFDFSNFFNLYILSNFFWKISEIRRFFRKLFLKRFRNLGKFWTLSEIILAVAKIPFYMSGETFWALSYILKYFEVSNIFWTLIEKILAGGVITAFYECRNTFWANIPIFRILKNLELFLDSKRKFFARVAKNTINVTRETFLRQPIVWKNFKFPIFFGHYARNVWLAVNAF